MSSFRPRAKRSLKRLSAFKEIDEHEVISELPSLSENILSEGLIGVYQNDCNSFSASILFTDAAIYFNPNEEWVRVGYHEIIELQPDTNKATASHIGLILPSNKVQKINIMGEEGKYRDYSTVYQFLHRVIGDLATG